MDLMGHMQVKCLGGKRYAFVCVDDFSRYTWVKFIIEKSNMFEVFKELCQLLQREKGIGIVKIRSHHSIEFENSKFSKLLHKVLAMSYQSQSHLIKIRWYRGRIELCKSHLKLCYMSTNFQIISGLKL